MNTELPGPVVALEYVPEKHPNPRVAQLISAVELRLLEIHALRQQIQDREEWIADLREAIKAELEKPNG